MRIESDSLGQIAIDPECYIGIHTARAVENFRVSGRTIAEIPSLIVALAQAKAALAK